MIISAGRVMLTGHDSVIAVLDLRVIVCWKAVPSDGGCHTCSGRAYADWGCTALVSTGVRILQLIRILLVLAFMPVAPLPFGDGHFCATLLLASSIGGDDVYHEGVICSGYDEPKTAGSAEGHPHRVGVGALMTASPQVSPRFYVDLQRHSVLKGSVQKKANTGDPAFDLYATYLSPVSTLRTKLTG